MDQLTKHVIINNTDDDDHNVFTVYYDSDVMIYYPKPKRIFSVKPGKTHVCNICKKTMHDGSGLYYSVETQRDHHTTLCNHSICHSCKRINFQDHFKPYSVYGSDGYAAITYPYCSNCQYRIDTVYFSKKRQYCIII